MLIPKPRGTLSGALFEAMRSGGLRWDDVLPVEPDHDDDAQISLWTLSELHYRGFDDADDALEWQPELLRVRRPLEESCEAALRHPYAPPDTTEPFASAFFDFVAGHD